MPEYVVAGVTGRVGSVVARELLAGGSRVTVIVRDAERGAEWKGRGAEVVVGSLDDRAFLAGALRGAQGFFVLLPENVPPHEFHAARRRMADAIAAAVKDSGVPHVVMLSAIAAVLPDGNGPAKDLHYLEQALLATGATVTRLRACFLQDNIAGVVEAAMQQGIYPNLLPSADAAVPMIATRDVGRFAAGALTTSPPEHAVVDLLGPVYSARQAADRLGARIGRALDVVTIPPSGHVAALTGAGLPRQLAEAVAEMMGAFGRGEFVPQGDRSLMGTTTLDDVLTGIVPRV